MMQVMEIVSKYEPDPELVGRRGIGKEGFTRCVKHNHSLKLPF